MGTPSTVRLPNSSTGVQFYIRQILAVLGVHATNHDLLASEIASVVLKFPRLKDDDDDRETREFRIEDLVGIVHRILNDGKFKYCKKRVILSTWLITLGHRPLVILFSGTSGVGKLTLASIVASKLMISNLLSTDSIRHAMRARTQSSSNPILFASTYECGRYLSPDVAEGLNETEKTVMGFRTQCSLMEPYIRRFLTNSVSKGRSVILEGVHLIPSILPALVRNLPSSAVVMCFVVTSEKDKHIEHMKWRGNQAGESTENKYVNSFNAIITIQDSITKEAATLGIPVLDSFSVDKCVSLIQATLRYLLTKSDTLPERRLETLHEAFFEYAQRCVAKSKLGLVGSGDGRERMASLTIESDTIIGML